MICVVICRESVGEMIAEHRRLAGQGVRLVEYRLDWLAGPVDVKRLLGDRPGPAIVTCRRPCDGGKFAGAEVERLAMLRAAIEAGAEYVDLEEDTARQIPRAGSAKRIVSHHDFQATPNDLEAIHARLRRLDADVVKIVTTANSARDNLRVLQLVRGAAVPTVGFTMGDLGTATRILCGRFGSPWTYAASDAQHAVAPGQIAFEQLRDLYRYEQIRPDTDAYGVIADPVGHSLSPLLHNTAFGHLKLNKVYVPLRVVPADLKDFMDVAPQLGLKGLSITIPHKEAVIPSLAWMDDGVRGIGACNTAVFDGRGWRGYNTDCLAALGSLEDALGGPRDGRSPLEGKTALLLGSGGVGKAIAVGLLQHGAEVVLSDGVPERASQLAARLGCRAVDWDARHQVAAQILVNGTPLGMHPKVDQTPLERQHLRPGMGVFDAVYNPEHTRLLQEASSCGCRVVTGVEMFVRQACYQFKLFTGQEGPADLMRRVIKEALGR